MTKTSKPILCVDFDGVIHSYVTPWTDAETISDPPVPGALRWLSNAIRQFDVHIYSTRSKSETARFAMLRWMTGHATKELGPDHILAMPYSDAVYKYPITFAVEKPPAFLTIDARALRFRGNWAELDPPMLLKFKPWNRA